MPILRALKEGQWGFLPHLQILPTQDIDNHVLAKVSCYSWGYVGYFSIFLSPFDARIFEQNTHCVCVDRKGLSNLDHPCTIETKHLCLYSMHHCIIWKQNLTYVP